MKIYKYKKETYLIIFILALITAIGFFSMIILGILLDKVNMFVPGEHLLETHYGFLTILGIIISPIFSVISYICCKKYCLILKNEKAQNKTT